MQTKNGFVFDAPWIVLALKRILARRGTFSRDVPERTLPRKWLEAAAADFHAKIVEANARIAAGGSTAGMYAGDKGTTYLFVADIWNEYTGSNEYRRLQYKRTRDEEQVGEE